MKIYIASSWKHRAGVELLTIMLRNLNHEVISWIENCDKEGSSGFEFEEWVKTDEANKCFLFDVKGAATCDLFIYYGKAGKDAAVELGIAYASGIPIVGLLAKDEDLGLMRKCVSRWFDNIGNLIAHITYTSYDTVKYSDNEKPWMSFDDAKKYGSIKINHMIKHLPVETGEISDGYHTFDELYEHRHMLYILLAMCMNGYKAWASNLHHDGSSYDNWFIMGLTPINETITFKPITYHLPDRLLHLVKGNPKVEWLEKAPEWDGHTSNDVIERLQNIIGYLFHYETIPQ